MWRFNKFMKLLGKIMLIVILWNFLTPYPVSAEPLTAPLAISSVDETKRWSDSEVDSLIYEISEIAKEAIEKAASEAAKAAVLAGLEREAALLREAQFWRLESEHWQSKEKQARKAGIKNAVIAGAVCLIGGLIFGVGGTLLMNN